jgi:3-hydroxyisobutyrate dehydrogenase-like beta-hydroxyacid dehydrogenase
MAGLPMDVRVVGDEIGRAWSIKMIRSVMVKGMEALTSECVLAAVAAGVEDEVLPSMLHGHPQLDVARHAAYNFERMMVHGGRRAAELEEVAKTLDDLGLPNRMALATVAWERQVAEARAGVVPAEDAPFRDFTDLLLPKIRERRG